MIAARLGTIVGGTAFFACPGHEYWHPDPAFYYDVGGGPVLDSQGHDYITDLINLLGPVKAGAGDEHHAVQKTARRSDSEPKKRAR